MSPITLLLVGLGGAVGALCRHKASVFMKPKCQSPFPWPTLAINLTSCTIAGCALAAATVMDSLAFTVLTMGFLGGFSTLSTMNCEAVDCFSRGDAGIGALYLAASYAGTLGAAAVGFALTAVAIG